MHVKTPNLSVLANLIETCWDEKECLRTAAEDAQDPELRSKLEMAARRWESCAGDLEHCLGAGRAPRTDTLGELHRNWQDVTIALAAVDDKMLLEECRRSEEEALADYRAALFSDLPPGVAEVIEKQYRTLSNGWQPEGSGLEDRKLGVSSIATFVPGAAS